MIDWPPRFINERDIQHFGAVTAPHTHTFPLYTGQADQVQPWYPCVMKFVVPSTGDLAEVTFPPGTTQPKIGFTSTPKITTTPDTPNAVNIYKVGTDLVFQFNMDVPEFNALRLM